MPCDAQSLIETAYANGYPGLSDRDLLEAIVAAACAAAGGGTGGTGNIKTYIADPNGEGVVPDAPTLPAIAYQEDGLGPTYTWRTDTHVWV